MTLNSEYINDRGRPVASVHPTAERNCLVNRNGLHFGVPRGVGRTREEAPLLPLCAREYTRSRPVQLSTKQSLEDEYSETARSYSPMPNRPGVEAASLTPR